MTKRQAALGISIAILAGAALYYFSTSSTTKETIKIGILHSQTGGMAISESAIIDAVLFAVQEINAQGGVLGALIEPVIADGKSNASIFAQQAEKLITQDKVSAIFGCWSSASRKAVRPIVEKYKNLLLYPVQYEGLEQSPNIIYASISPNSQIIPSISWCFHTIGSKFFLVGSDYVYPRSANAIIKDYIQLLGGTVVGEVYKPLGSTDFYTVVQEIVTAKPDIILNTINGQSNYSFFYELKAAGISSENIPCMSYSIGEQELSILNAKDLAGNYAVWSYFQSIPTPENKKFVERFKEQYGSNRVISDPMETAYACVHLWARAARVAGTTDPTKVRTALKGQGINSPEGIIFIDPVTQHAWSTPRIGKILPTGQFEIVWSSSYAIAPEPFPPTRTPQQWQDFLDDLQRQWNGKWEYHGEES